MAAQTLSGPASEGPRGLAFWALAAVFALFVLFLYGPTLTILVLSLQGPEGGMTFPMRGLSLHWYGKLMEGIGVIDIWAAFRRSLALGAVVMLLTVLLSLSAALAYRKPLRGGNALFFVTVASLIMPSIVVSLGIGLEFRLIDGAIKAALQALEWDAALEAFTTTMGMYTSALAAHLTWTLPFGLLILFAVFNRFDRAYEEAATDLGASPWQAFRHVVLPLIAPSLVGVGLFGFTLSWDEIARTAQAIGDVNTLPLELQGLTTTVTTPVIYALGTVTTLVSIAVILAALAAVALSPEVGRMTRLLLLNPNTTASVTRLLADHVGRVLGDAIAITAVTAPFGEPYIADEVSYAIAGHAVIDAWRADRDAHGEADLVLLGCFGDPGLHALRSLTRAPVVGLAEAAIREALALGDYAIVTGGERWPPMLRRLALGLGLPDPVDRILTVAPSGIQLAQDPEGAIALLGDACVAAATRLPVRSIVLGGAGLAGMARRIAPRLSIPVIDSVEAGARALLARG